MKDLLYGLFCNLQQRCQMLCMLLEQHQYHSDVRLCRAETLNSIVEFEDEIEGLLKDPSLTEDTLLVDHLRDYRRLSEKIDICESYLVPVILRYSPSDHYLFAFLAQAIAEIKYPFPNPVVSTTSDDYYWSYPKRNIILTPVLEAYSLLGLPDLFHELGHVLVEGVFREENAILDNFWVDLANHFSAERLRIQTEEGSSEYEKIIESIEEQWMGGWDPKFTSDMIACYLTGPSERLRMQSVEEIIKSIEEQWMGGWDVEFTCDMIACYLVGPSYGWTNLRLCASSSDNVFLPGGDNIHPPDDARTKGIVEMLTLMGLESDATQIKQRWDEYVSLTEKNPPSEYDLYYPTSLLKKLAQRVLVGCREIGLKQFQVQDPISGNISIPNLLNNAWKEFFARPDEYPAWEQRQLAELKMFLGCLIPTEEESAVH